MLHLLATFLVSNWCSSFWPPWVSPGSPRSTESIDILFDITGHTFRFRGQNHQQDRFEAHIYHI
jgi:hypothetical protein